MPRSGVDLTLTDLPDFSGKVSHSCLDELLASQSIYLTKNTQKATELIDEPGALSMAFSISRDSAILEP